MKKTAPHVQSVLDTLLAQKPITAEEVNALLKDGKQSDLELAAILSSRRPYGPVLYSAAMSAYKDCEHEGEGVCVKCSMVIR